MNTNELLTAYQLAVLCDTKEKNIKYWYRCKRLPKPYIHGNIWLFDKQDVAEFIDTNWHIDKYKKDQLTSRIKYGV